jgi:predicted dehydrogenase/threonine dehydrogenase-like Zn-dependent dehydrogenase
MKAVLLWPRHGNVTVEEIPAPQLRAGQVLIRNQHSLISAGTERARIEAGRQSLFGKAREHPKQVRQVLESVQQVGLTDTYRLVSDRLDAPVQVGYSSAGVVLEAGAGVEGMAPGTRVAAGGAGYASHAEVVSVPANLCVPLSDTVPSSAAAFATVGAIALQGIHQADVQPGSRVVVIGLGLVGQLAARLLGVYGCDVIGVDRDRAMLDLAARGGIPVLARDDGDLSAATRAVWSGAGADAVLVTAATRSADPVELAGELARDRAVVAIVGDVAVTPPRPSYYGKELSIRFSRSYGPGRYDPRYEEGGIDYPAGYVPWTERRNMAEIVRLLDRKLLDVDSLQPAEFRIDQAAHAYDLLTARGPERRVAILLSYGCREEPCGTDHRRPVALRSRTPRRRVDGAVRIATVGAGSFASRTLFPQLARNREVRLSWITTAGGLSARSQGVRWGFSDAVASLREGLALGDTEAVMVLSRHESHAAYAAEVLRAGRILYCEKPLALDERELDEVAAAWTEAGVPAMVGFNRRFAPPVRELRALLAARSPMQVSYRVFAGRLPRGHWYFDERQGGRTLGEVCHFVDLAGYLIGCAPVGVRARCADRPGDGRRAQSVSLLIDFADGSLATVVYGGSAPPGAPKELVEVAADGLAARIEDYRSLTVWSESAKPRVRRYRRAAKGHAEEMRALVDLCHGREPSSACDFTLSMWSTLTTWRAVESATEGRGLPVEPRLPNLRAALGFPAG